MGDLSEEHHQAKPWLVKRSFPVKLLELRNPAKGSSKVELENGTCRFAGPSCSDGDSREHPLLTRLVDESRENVS
ncbi:hypothetical protein FQK07_07030 [Synechococcus sp. BSF8S]|jgi:hypothetical protein|uniref:hypothetical protein n=1 Tax=Synechococcales TaxID=1890424 RepID=UPI001626C9FB|nr:MULTISPECIES: hypothetical protein [unclassified Synechococcus]MBC1261030.1 hypothetical protein [Synechococcus sp. BSF8S]MBC1263933.1 hypothetical protein [Synechococcus sp. BSA11S]